ncbi:MAG: cadherin-like domain-containing protein [Saprospiraceae bacterium]|nr:cadherin-like domain-containing protein [Saprospiraceae bacterium]
MKATLITIAMVCIILLEQGFSQVTGVKYLMKYNTTTCKFDACIVITAGSATTAPQRAQFNSQYSVVVPTGTTISIGENDSHNPIQNNQTYGGTTPLKWVISSAVLSPAAAPTLDFHSITPTLSPTSFYNNLATNDTIRLFSLNVNPMPSCGVGIRPFQNGVDPGSSAAGMNGGDFTNGFTIGGTAQDYTGNLTTITASPVPMSAVATCTAGININLTMNGNACQNAFTYAWSGPGGYTGSTQDVAFTPAVYETNGGTYQVIVTDNLQCKDTLTIDAYPKPSGGPDVLLCDPSTITLKGTNPVSGNWTPGGSNPLGAVLGSTSNGEASLDMSFAEDGLYSYIYTAGTCSDTTVVRKFNANAGDDPAPLDCYASSSTTLAASGTGDWSLGAGSAGNALIANINDPNTEVSQFSAAGNYYFVWNSGGCTDTVLVVAGSNCSGCPVNNNILNQPAISSYCGASPAVTLDGNAANPVGGTYLWEHKIDNGPWVVASGLFEGEDYVTGNLTDGVHSFRRLYYNTSGTPCTDTSNVIALTVEVIPSQPTGLAANPNPVCLGNIINLSVNNISGSTYTWTASSPDAGLVSSTTNSTTMTPTAAGLYIVSVTRTVNGCESTAASLGVTATTTPPTPADVTWADPSACEGSDGSITIGGLAGSTAYVVNYTRNGVPVTVSRTTNGSGDLTITGLKAGSYANITLSIGTCTSGAYVGPIELNNPNAPSPPANITATEVDICANATTTVSVSSNPGATYAWSSSDPSVLVLDAPSTTNSAVFRGVSEGTAIVSVTQNVGGCVSIPSTIEINVAPAAPTPSNISGQNPTVCEGLDGSLTFTGLPTNSSFELGYRRNGIDNTASITTNGAGTAVLGGLNAGSYTNFQLTNEFGCVSGIFAGPVTLSDPATSLPSNLTAGPNPACLGSVVNLSLTNVIGASYNWSASSESAGLAGSSSNSTTMTPVSAGSYTISVTQTVAGCTSPPAQIVIVVRNDCYNPDFGVTYQNVVLTGDLSTNDAGSNGATYGIVNADGGNPDICLPTVASNGTYSFVCATIGEYNFTVTVCKNQECVPVPLTITVLEQESSTNPPVAHPDYAYTKMNTGISINIVANDKCQSLPNCNLGTPTMVTSPTNGNYSIATGIYTPSNGFVGKDSFQYRICQTPATPVSCDEEWVYITVFPGNASNFTNAMDDYNQTNLNQPLSVGAGQGVKANDVDIEGNNTTVGSFTKTVAGKGTLMMAADGSYNFTPVTDYVGPVDFAYQLCDNGSPSACDSATLHILVLASLPTGSVGNFVWADVNGNGVQNAGELGIANITVRLYNDLNALIATTTTNASGMYIFENVLPGNYYVKFDYPAGYELSPAFAGTTATDSDITETNGAGTTNIFTVNPGEFNLDVDAGFYICSKIGNIVWYDVNKNDKWETTENGINGIRVELFRLVNGNWIFWDYQITGHKPNTPSDDGWYEFCAPPGTYYVKVILPPNGLVPAKPFIGGNPFRDSDITGANGPVTTNSITVNAGQNKLDIGAGFYPQAIAGNLVWMDNNLNGIQDSGEPKVSGVLVQAFEAGTNMLYGQATTDSDGLYKLGMLPKTDLYYKFTPPSGLNATYANMGADNINSDVDHSNGYNTTRVISMQSGVYNENIDLGLAFGVLPVTWVSVNATKVKEGHKISWETANEINLAYYQVQMYDNQQKSFVNLSDKIYPVDNNRPVKNYFYLNTEVEKSGWYHYRVRQVDLDGSESYSDKVSVINDANSRISLYPNPAINDVEVGIDLDEESDVKIFVYNVRGDMVSELSYNRHFERGSHTITFDVSQLPAGAYTFSIDINGSMKNTIVVKD